MLIFAKLLENLSRSYYPRPGRDSLVGIDSLDDPGMFSAPVQAGPGTHPVPTKWVPDLFPRVKTTGTWCSNPP